MESLALLVVGPDASQSNAIKDLCCSSRPPFLLCSATCAVTATPTSIPYLCRIHHNATEQYNTKEGL